MNDKQQITIPRCMSSQHPDNANIPFFAENGELGGEDEIQEAYYAFSHLGCDEQMWDCEGKEVDDFVVKKLLTKYENFFREKKLGKDVFLTLRVPNPEIEKTEAKVLLETLESIPRSFDTSKIFYNDEDPPIFEVILPMTTSPEAVDRIYRYYTDFVAGKEKSRLKKDDITVAEWIGEFQPKKINVIPLFEDKERLLSAHDITRAYLKDKNIAYQRVFLARSDPAMNYGLVSAVLLNKIALFNLQKLEEEIGVKIYPILGVGSAPFRGNLRPQTVDRIIREYPSVHTFTIQSAFKYDNSPADVREAIEKLRTRQTGAALEADEERILKIINKYSEEYSRQMTALAPIINKVSEYVPRRRKRKLHVGLFGYSREVRGVILPRAISFVSVLYSIGLPPEVFGLSALDEDDLRFVRRIYVNFDDDLRDAFRYLNTESKFLPPELKEKIDKLKIDFKIDKNHKEITDRVLEALAENKTDDLEEHILSAAVLRKFLG